MRALGIALLMLLAGCGGNVRLADRANFTAALQDLLAQRGHLCLAKYDWPITVADDAASADARQMPVLEKLGLVVRRDTIVRRADTSTAADSAPAREYALTAEGRRQYLHVPIVIRTATQHITHPADLCAATLTLDRLVGWDPPQTRAGRATTSLLFTYHVAPATWAQQPEMLHAFPALARAIEGDGTMQLRVGVHLTDCGWVADELDER